MALIDDVLVTRNAPFQLVRHYDDVHDKHKEFPVWLDVKYDGVFCAVIVDQGVTQFVSRTGKLFYGISDVPIDVPEEDGVWIGELINETISLESLSGLVNPNRVNPWLEEDDEAMTYARIIFHDALTLQEFKAGHTNVRHMERRARIPFFVEIAVGWLVVDEESLHNEAQEVIRNGGEGICIKHLGAGWLAGHKGWHITKIVRDLHIDLKCLAVETGKGKRTGQIARLQFMYKGKTFWADLGKGWTDDRRIQLTSDWEYSKTVRDVPYPVGKVFHVKALQESSKGVLRLPKVQELRIDKDEEDVVATCN